MAIIFIEVWIGLTLPISLAIVFSLLKPLIVIDTTGLSMIIVVICIGIIDAYIGIKIYENKIQPWLKRECSKIVAMNNK